MLSKKIFKIDDCCFNLPDDFNGTCGEALMLLAQYRLEQEKQSKINVTPKDLTNDCYKACLYAETGKAAITYQIYDLQDNGTWKPMISKEQYNTSGQSSLS